MTSKTTINWWRDWLAWLLIGALLYGIFCIVTLARDVGRPFPGFLTYHNIMGAQIDMVRNAPAWWWGISETLPAISDKIIQVEDTPFINLPALLDEGAVYEAAWLAGQENVTILVERAGARQNLEVPLILFSWQHHLDFLFGPIAISSTLWLLAWLLFRAAPTDPTQRLVAALLILMGVVSIGIQPTLFSYDQPRFLLIGNIQTTFAAMLMGLLFLKFALRFPYELVSPWSKVAVWAMSVWVSVIAVIYLASHILTYTQGLTPIVRTLDTIYFRNYIPLILTGILAVMVRMVADSFFLRNERRQRQEARILLAALLLMLPTVVLVGHYMGGDSQVLGPLRLLADSRFFPLALPLAFAAISLRYHTFARAENWFFLALLLAGSGLLANAGVALLFGNRLSLIWETAVPPTLVFFFFSALVGVLAGRLTSWRGWLGRVFAWDRVSYQAVQQVGQQLLAARADDESGVVRALAQTLQNTLEVTRAAVWLMGEESLALVAQAGNWQPAPPTTLAWPPDLPHHPLRRAEIRGAVAEEIREQVTAVLPLTLAGELLGLIAIGPRWDTAVFDDRDLEILSLIGQQATLFLQNSRQTARLRAADQQLLATLTQARQKTAQDLHDHLLPNLSRLQLNLLTAAASVTAEPDSASQILSQSQQDLAASARLVRRIQQDMVSRPLEHGLRPYLLEISERFQRDTGIAVTQSLPADLDVLVQDTQLRETLYAVWLQALDNVQRHAQASQVIINLEMQAGLLTFVIEDNGRGSSLEEREAASRAGNFGLRSLQIRLETVGGECHFWSQPGQGSRLTGHLPLAS